LHSKAHELAILSKQMEFMEKGHHNRIAEIGAMADANESPYSYKFAAKSGNSTIDALTTSIRPVLSYAFFILYAYIKIVQFFITSNQAGRKHQGCCTSPTRG
jgi:hypothetical protein